MMGHYGGRLEWREWSGGDDDDAIKRLNGNGQMVATRKAFIAEADEWDGMIGEEVRPGVKALCPQVTRVPLG